MLANDVTAPFCNIQLYTVADHPGRSYGRRAAALTVIDQNYGAGRGCAKRLPQTWGRVIIYKSLTFAIFWPFFCRKMD